MSETTWPGAFNKLGEAFSRVRHNQAGLLVVVVLATVTNGISLLASGNPENPNQLASTVSWVLALLLGAVTTIVALANVRGHDLKLRGLVEGMQKRFFWLVVYAIIFTLLVTLGFILLIVPGVIALTWLIFGSLLVADTGVNAADAIPQSRRMAKGNAGKIWGVFGVSILIGVGLFAVFLVPLIIAALMGEPSLTAVLIIACGISGYFQVVLTNLLALLYLHLKKTSAHA